VWYTVVGDCVLAQWLDKHYYPATVLCCTTNKVKVEFCDNYVASVRPNKLIVCALIPVGLSLLADQWDNECYEPAVVRSYSYATDGTVDGYNVTFKLLQPETETRSMFTLL